RNERRPHWLIDRTTGAEQTVQDSGPNVPTTAVVWHLNEAELVRCVAVRLEDACRQLERRNSGIRSEKVYVLFPRKAEDRTRVVDGTRDAIIRERFDVPCLSNGPHEIA